MIVKRLDVLICTRAQTWKSLRIWLTMYMANTQETQSFQAYKFLRYHFRLFNEFVFYQLKNKFPKLGT